MAAATAWVGTVMHTPILGQTEVLLNHLLIVKDGVIVHLGPYTSCEDALRQHSVASDRVKQLSPQQWLMPGFVGESALDDVMLGKCTQHYSCYLTCRHPCTCSTILFRCGHGFTTF
jgi:hypothetical protein